jgi:alpha-amylase
MRYSLKLVLSAAAILLALGSCELLGFSIRGIAIEQGDQSMAVGDTLQLSVRYDPAYAFAKGVSWVSSAPDFVSVSTEGMIEALAPGEAIVTATYVIDASKTASIRVSVAGAE